MLYSEMKMIFIARSSHRFSQIRLRLGEVSALTNDENQLYFRTKPYFTQACHGLLETQAFFYF